MQIYSSITSGLSSHMKIIGMFDVSRPSSLLVALGLPMSSRTTSHSRRINSVSMVLFLAILPAGSSSRLMITSYSFVIRTVKFSRPSNTLPPLLLFKHLSTARLAHGSLLTVVGFKPTPTIRNVPHFGIWLRILAQFVASH